MAATGLIEDALDEILLRVSPDEPADLVRASVVHKRWRRIVTDPAFLRRYREFHRTPPLLGFFHNHPPEDVGPMPRFVATTAGASPLRQPEFDGEEWSAMNCHHGRVLFDTGNYSEGFGNHVVWDPITGDRHRVHLPETLRTTNFCSPVVICAVGGCNSLHCRGGPFLVVGVRFVDGLIQVFVYSSEDGAWTQPASIDQPAFVDPLGVRYKGAQIGTIMGDVIYSTIGVGDGVLKYEVGKSRLSVFESPEVFDRGATLLQMEDGSLGLAGSKGLTVHLWSRKETPGWALCRVLDFEKLLPSCKLFDMIQVNGFAEGHGLLFVGTFAGTFTYELKSGKVKRIGGPRVFFDVVPFMAFYTPDCASSKLALQAGTSQPLLSRSMQ